MTMTEKELVDLLKSNPALKVREYPSGRHEKDHATEEGPEATKFKQAYIKYGNHKLFIYEDGFLSLSKDEKDHGNVITIYDSIREYRRHQELLLAEKAGLIHGLVWQYTMTLQEGFVYQGKRIRPITYTADFFYFEKGNNQPTVEDVKGLDRKSGKHITSEKFQLKWKMAKYQHPEFKFEIY